MAQKTISLTNLASFNQALTQACTRAGSWMVSMKATTNGFYKGKETQTKGHLPLAMAKVPIQIILAKRWL